MTGVRCFYGFVALFQQGFLSFHAAGLPHPVHCGLIQGWGMMSILMWVATNIVLAKGQQFFTTSNFGQAIWFGQPCF